MKRIIKVTVFLITIAIASTASCASIKDDYGACLTKDLLNQLFDANHNKDEKAWFWLMKNGCLTTKKEWQISVIERTFSGKTKIRVYTKNDSVILWTDSSSILM